MIKALIFVLFLPCVVISATQVKIVGTGANDASIGDIAITLPGNCTADDNLFTGGVTGDQIQDAETHQRLKATMTGNLFTIPLSATIDSIKAEYSMLDARNKDEGLDLEVKILKAGVVSGNDQSKTATVPGTETVRVYAPVDTVGGDDLAGTWGVALTPADVNNANFGVTYRGKVVGASGRYQLKIDFIRITVSYTAAVTATATETIYPEAIANRDTWDSTGSGATKTIRITDGVDANYIWTAAKDSLDRYSMTNLKANDNQVTSYDSITIYVTAQDNGAGADSLRFSPIVSGTIKNGTKRDLNGTWTEYIDGHTTNPAGGSWTKADIDTLIMEFKSDSVITQVRVSECSVVVFMTLENPPFAYYFNNTNKCTNVADFAKEMDVLFDNQNYDTLKIDVADGALADKNFFTNFRGATWKTGGFIVEFKVVKSVATPDLKIRINSVVSSTCAITESTPYTANINCDSTGDYVINIPSHDWVTAADADDVIQLEFNFINGIGQPIDSLWIVVGAEPLSVLRSSVEVAIPAPDAPSGCANTDSLVPNATTAIAAFDQWETVGGADKDLITRDQSDATYIKDSVNSQQQKLLLDDVTGTIPADATIDFLQLQLRIYGHNTKKIRFTARLESGDSAIPVNSCLSLSIRSAETTPDVWIDETINYLGTPTGLTCNGAFTLAGLDSLGVRFTINRIEGDAAFFHLRVAQIIMFVCYTEAGGAQNFRRRRLILQQELGRIEPVWDGYFISNIIDGSPTSEVSLVYGFAQPKIWLWRN